MTDQKPRKKAKLIPAEEVFADARKQPGYQEAYDALQKVLKEYPTYGEPLAIYQRLKPLAQALSRSNEVERIDKELDRLRSVK